MNKIRKNIISEKIKELKSIQSQVETIIEELEEVRNDEESAYDSLPYGIQESERGETMQENIEELDEQLSAIEELTSNIEEITGGLQDIIDK